MYIRPRGTNRPIRNSINWPTTHFGPDAVNWRNNISRWAARFTVLHSAPDLPAPLVGGAGLRVATRQDLEGTTQDFTKHLPGHPRWQHGPQITAEASQEVVPHLNREGAPLPLCNESGCHWKIKTWDTVCRLPVVNLLLGI